MLDAQRRRGQPALTVYIVVYCRMYRPTYRITKLTTVTDWLHVYVHLGKQGALQ